MTIISYNKEKYIKLETFNKLRSFAKQQRAELIVLNEFKTFCGKEWEMFKSLTGRV